MKVGFFVGENYPLLLNEILVFFANVILSEAKNLKARGFK